MNSAESHQYSLNFADFERIFRKRYKAILLVASLTLGFSLFFARLKPSIYLASASVKVEHRTSISPMMEFAPLDNWDNIETQAKVITSFPVIRKAAELLGLVPQSDNPEEAATDPRVIEILQNLRSKVLSTMESGTNVIQITAKTTNAKQSAQIANAVAQAYKIYALAEKKAQVTSTRKFVEQQLKDSDRQLSEAESTIADFEQSHETPQINSEIQLRESEFQSLEQQMEHLGKEKKILLDQKSDLEKSKAQLQAHRKAQESIPGSALDSSTALRTASQRPKMTWMSRNVANDPGIGRLNEKLIELQMKLDDMSLYYRSDHPSFLAVEEQLILTMSQMLTKSDERLAQIGQERATIGSRISDLYAILDQLPAEQMRYARMARNLSTAEKLNSLLHESLQKTLISEAGIVDDVKIMSFATEPKRPISKNPNRIIVIGLILGLLLGVFLAVVWEIMDTSIGTIEEMESFLQIPVLASIPNLEIHEQARKLANEIGQDKITREVVDHAGLTVHFSPKTPISESYRILRTNIQFLAGNQKPIRTLTVTSTTMQEGKSTTISNLAAAFSQDGAKVILLGCNLRRPYLGRIFGIPESPGISEILIGKWPWRKCVRTMSDLAVGSLGIDSVLRTPGLENLSIIPAGNIPPNPAELLASARFDAFLKEVTEEYSLVLLDVPPVLPVTDSTLMAKKSDATILVYRAGKVPRNTLRRSKQRLESLGAHIIGLVLNDVRPELGGASDFYRYHMGYYGPSQHQSEIKKRSGLVVPLLFGMKSVCAYLARGVLRNTILAIALLCTSLASSDFGSALETDGKGPNSTISRMIEASEAAPRERAPITRCYSVQLASFAEIDRAMIYLAGAKRKHIRAEIRLAEIAGKGTFYRIHSGLYKEWDKALAYCQELKIECCLEGFVVSLECDQVEELLWER